MQHGPDKAPPEWPRIVAAICGAAVLVYFMVLVYMPAERVCGSAGAESIVIALGLALGLAFVGGDATMRGTLRLPFLQDQPIIIGAVGGVATFLLVLVVARQVLACQIQSRTNDPVSEIASSTVQSATNDATPPPIPSSSSKAISQKQFEASSRHEFEGHPGDDDIQVLKQYCTPDSLDSFRASIGPLKLNPALEPEVAKRLQDYWRFHTTIECMKGNGALKEFHFEYLPTKYCDSNFRAPDYSRELLCSQEYGERWFVVEGPE